MTRRLSPQSPLFVAMLGAISALAPLGIDMSLPALPQIGRTLPGASSMVLQSTLGIFILSFALGQLVLGPLSDRIGRRPVLLYGMAIFLLAGLFCTFAPNGALLLVARFVQGFAACAGVVVGRAIVRDVYADRARSAAMQAYIATVFGVAPIVAPLIGAALLPLGWRAIYAALAAIGALMWLGVLYLVPETAPKHPGAELSVGRAYAQFFRLPRALPLTIIVAATFAGHFAFVSGSPFVLEAEFGLSSGVYALDFATTAAALLIGSYVSARLTHRLGSEWLLAAGSYAFAVVGLATFASLVILGHPHPATFVALMAAWSFLFGAAVPHAFAAGLDGAGPIAGVAAAALGAMQSLGGTLGSTVNGALGFEPSANVGWCAGVAGLIVVAAYRASIAADVRGGFATVRR